MSNLMNIASELSEPELTMESCPTPQSSLTCVSSSSPVVLNSTEDLRTWLQLAFPANHSAQLATTDEGQTMNETCGQLPSSAYAWYDQSTHSWRTFQACLLVDILEPFSETWPRQGMTVNGQFFQLAPLVHHIHEKGCSCWPTPAASDSTGGGSAAEAQRRLSGMKRPSGAHITLRLKDLYKLRYGEQPKATFAEWLMGWAPNWSALSPLEMDKFRLWQQQHGIY